MVKDEPRSQVDLALDARSRYEKATACLDPPFAIVDLHAFWHNASDLTRRAGGKPIRLASKSVRCRELQRQVLLRRGYRGTLCFTLAEALWLASHGHDDLLVGYPTVDRAGLSRLRQLLRERPDMRIILMVDSIDHLDLIARETERSVRVDVCIDVDAGFWLFRGRIRLGVKRSPLRTPAQAAGLAREIVRRPHLRLVGAMAYEAQIAGVPDSSPWRPLTAAGVRLVKAMSRRELTERRAAILAAVRAVTPIEFFNAGGTGSLETTAADEAVTEVAAGSGLFGPALFSGYRTFDPRPAAFFALPVVRKPTTDVVTVLGGGYVASGPADDRRLPEPHLPRGLRLDPREGAGEVQTPVTGRAAGGLRLGDRVYFRHAKAGELCERFAQLYLVRDDAIVDEVPTYRGEHQAFL
jgi:D-serine deaminase-like pyridoxal phosphate-dependent protein